MSLPKQFADNWKQVPVDELSNLLADRDALDWLGQSPPAQRRMVLDYIELQNGRGEAATVRETIQKVRSLIEKFEGIDETEKKFRPAVTTGAEAPFDVIFHRCLLHERLTLAEDKGYCFSDIVHRFWICTAQAAALKLAIGFLRQGENIRDAISQAKSFREPFNAQAQGQCTDRGGGQ
jgi:hypothetical protein